MIREEAHPPKARPHTNFFSGLVFQVLLCYPELFFSWQGPIILLFCFPFVCVVVGVGLGHREALVPLPPEYWMIAYLVSIGIPE